MVQKATALGDYVRNHRVAADLSLREAAEKIGVTHVFLGEIERGRKALPRERFASVVRAIPGTVMRDLEELAAAQTDGVKMQLTLRDAGPRYETIGELLLRRAKKQDLADPDLDELIRLLKGGE